MGTIQDAWNVKRVLDIFTTEHTEDTEKFRPRNPCDLCDPGGNQIVRARLPARLRCFDTSSSSEMGNNPLGICMSDAPDDHSCTEDALLGTLVKFMEART